jgi:hypothetical protein
MRLNEALAIHLYLTSDDKRAAFNSELLRKVKDIIDYEAVKAIEREATNPTEPE